jgi:uncharacterized protein Usg
MKAFGLSGVQRMRRSDRAPLELQLKGYRLATAEIVYHMPDHPGLLQTFVWQHYDLDPHYPELRKFLDFWTKNIDGKLHSVTVARRQLIGPARHRHAVGIWQLH